MKKFIGHSIHGFIVKTFSIAAVISSTGVYAGAVYPSTSLDTMNARIIKLEKENQVLKEEVVKNKNAIVTSSEKNTKRVRSLKESVEKQSSRMKMDGFMSAGILKGEGDYKYGSVDKHVDFSEGYHYRSDSVVGLQFNYALAEQTNAIVQLVATGSESFKVEAEWAYLRHYFDDDFHLSVGRFRLPFYYHSETVEVGFAYPMVRPATEVYISEVTSIEGASLYKGFELGDHRFSLRLDLFGTSTELLSVESGHILVAEYEYGDLLARAVYAEMDLEIKGVDLTIENRGYTGALVYDDGTYMSSFEAIRTDPKSGPFYSFEAFVAMFARKFGPWTPYLSVATIYSGERNDDPLAYISRMVQSPEEFTAPTVRFSGDSVTPGFRYDYSSKIALKFEATHFINGEEEPDGLGGVNTSLGYLTGDGPSGEDDDLVVYSFVVDAVF